MRHPVVLSRSPRQEQVASRPNGDVVALVVSDLSLYSYSESKSESESESESKLKSKPELKSKSESKPESKSESESESESEAQQHILPCNAEGCRKIIDLSLIDI